MSHGIETISSTHDLEQDRARIRFRCMGCDLRGTIDVHPAHQAAELLVSIKRLHPAREAAVAEDADPGRPQWPVMGSTSLTATHSNPSQKPEGE